MSKKIRQTLGITFVAISSLFLIPHSSKSAPKGCKEVERLCKLQCENVEEFVVQCKQECVATDKALLDRCQQECHGATANPPDKCKQGCEEKARMSLCQQNCDAKGKKTDDCQKHCGTMATVCTTFSRGDILQGREGNNCNATVPLGVVDTFAKSCWKKHCDH